VARNPLSVLERCAQQKTSGVVDKRRYVHELCALEKVPSKPGISKVLCRPFAPRNCNMRIQRNVVCHWNVRHGFRRLKRALRSAQKATISKTRSWTTARPVYMPPCGQPRGRQDTTQPDWGPQLERVFTENPSHGERGATRDAKKNIFVHKCYCVGPLF
jgi:hypothetical protein